MANSGASVKSTEIYRADSATTRGGGAIPGRRAQAWQERAGVGQKRAGCEQHGGGRGAAMGREWKGWWCRIGLFVFEPDVPVRTVAGWKKIKGGKLKRLRPEDISDMLQVATTSVQLEPSS